LLLLLLPPPLLLSSYYQLSCSTKDEEKSRQERPLRKAFTEPKVATTGAAQEGVS
jgi:hypothetical protein